MEEVEVNHEKGETDEEKKEYLINKDNIDYKLLIIINYEKNTVEFKINQNIFIPKYIYRNKYNFKEIKNILKLGDDFNNIEQIIYFLNVAHSNNKIFIEDEDIIIKVKFNISSYNNKEKESVLILNQNDLDNNEKFEFIISEINTMKKNNIELIDKKFNEIVQRLSNIESKMNEKIKNNTENIKVETLKKEIEDNNQNTIQTLKKEIKIEIDDLKKIVTSKPERKETPKEIKTEKNEQKIEELNKNENKKELINIKKDDNNKKNLINELKNEIKLDKDNNNIIKDNKNKTFNLSKNNNITKKTNSKKEEYKINKIEKLYDPDDDLTNLFFFIMIIGESGVGKTWIFNNFFSMEFAQSPSLGIESEEIFFKINDISLLSLNIVVSPGDKKLNQLNFVTNKDLIIFVYAIDNRSSFENLKETIKEIKSKNNKDTYYILVGNKNDLELKRVVKKEEGENLAKNENLNYFFECSAKNGDNVENIFFEACKILYKNKAVNE